MEGDFLKAHPRQIPPRPPFSKGGKTHWFLLFGAILISRCPFLINGLGDYDAADTYRLITGMLDTGAFGIGHGPGFPLHYAVLYLLMLVISKTVDPSRWVEVFSLASNSYTLLCCILAVMGFYVLLNAWNVSRPFWWTCLYAFFPYFYMNSAVTAEDIPALMMFTWSLVALWRSEDALAGLGIGLTAGIRINYALFVIPCAYWIIQQRRGRGAVIRFLLCSGTVGFLSYLPSIVTQKGNLQFLFYHSDMDKLSLAGKAKTVVARGMHFLGLLTLPVMAGLLCRSGAHLQTLWRERRPLIVFSGLCILATLYPFFKLPFANTYLLAMTPVLYGLFALLFVRNFERWTTAALLLLPNVVFLWLRFVDGMRLEVHAGIPLMAYRHDWYNFLF